MEGNHLTGCCAKREKGIFLITGEKGGDAISAWQQDLTQSGGNAVDSVGVKRKR